MLTIRPEQMWALSSNASRSILLEHAKTAHAAAANSMGQRALEATATAAVALCIRYRMESTADQLRIMDLAMVFGPDWQLPHLQWLDEGMRNTAITDPGLRLRKVWRQALRRIARETEWPSS